MSFYQKYRPDNFGELDLGGVRDFFKRLLMSGEVAHAYLLVGPRGSGKTSSARILAKVVNCELNIDENGKLKKLLVEPCGKCESCRSIKSGGAVDVVEMDAASHRGIDDIREIKERVNLSPAILPKKVYIIDEVHMLTNEAFNALLKTLEEPPEHCLFVLCTTEKHKVPETILSRCVTVSFTKAGKLELIKSLKRACDGEHIEADDEAIELLADVVDGSFREAHKLLEQVASLKQRLTVESVREQLKVVGGDRIVKLMQAVSERETAKIFELLGNLEDEGVAVSEIILRLLEQLRLQIKVQTNLGQEVSLFQKRLMTRLLTAAKQVKWSPLPYMPLEMALVFNARNKKGGTGAKKIIERVNNDTGQKVEKSVAKKTLTTNNAEIIKIQTKWWEFCEELGEQNLSLASMLKAGRPAEIEGEALILEVGFKFHKEQLEVETKKRLVEESLKKWCDLRSLKCRLVNKESLKVDSFVTSLHSNGEANVKTEVAKMAEEVFG